MAEGVNLAEQLQTVMKIGFAYKERTVCINVNNKYHLLYHIFFCILYILDAYFSDYSISVLICEIWGFLHPPSECFYLEFNLTVPSDADESNMEMNFTSDNY